MTDEDEVVVTRNEDETRWEAHVGGVLAGFAAYRPGERVVVFTHTEVDPAFKGRGVGDALARHALDEVAAEGTRRVRPACPFIRAWIDRHPDYAALVQGATTAAAPAPDRPEP
ncbi:GNAT family N-acetyltransferase [Fodinibacter luteus]|uniref:GNAT family N-acetyltransferase n=1 Tax=Fodinibacter luteus TaxID=552064 RepID=A0ABP8KDB1_9MICO